MKQTLRTLEAARCRRCGESFHPRRDRCPHCRSDQLDHFEAGPGGRLYSHSTIHVGSGAQRPYTLGYVDLDGGPRLLGRIHVDDPESLPCDSPVVLVERLDEEQAAGRPINVFVPVGEEDR